MRDARKCGIYNAMLRAESAQRTGACMSEYVRALAPSTMLRMVPLPRFAGEDLELYSAPVARRLASAAMIR
jgi:hypothetical protein